MGEMADLELDKWEEQIGYLEASIDHQIRNHRCNLKKKVWSTRNKGDIKIKDMDNRHLRNTINMLSKDVNVHQIIPEIKEIKASYIKLMRKQLNKNLKKVKVAGWDISQG